MPELPEVESVCRVMRRVLQGRQIARAEVADDPIVLRGTPAAAVVAALEGRTVVEVGRRGKYWWLELDSEPWVYGHLGMSGWIRELGGSSLRLHSHGEAPMDDADGRPRFLKVLLEASDGGRVAFTDGRRLGRFWLAGKPEDEARVRALGPDAFAEPLVASAWRDRLRQSKSPVKARLLDQAFVSGIGNWIADEVLYRAGIAPQRTCDSLSEAESERLRGAVAEVLAHAVEVDADSEKFPEDWLFHHRWGGAKGKDTILGRAIRRDTVAGRTTAWVPDLQS